MSNHAKVRVFYGICYELDSKDAGKFHTDDDSETEGENSPAWMAANLYKESREGVEVVRFGYCDLPRFALAVAGTVSYGDCWGPLEVKTRSMRRGDDDAALYAFCEEHGLSFSEPKWWAVPYYG